ncbi:MAG: bi-functional transferase/deacetylase, partial [Candidatus Methanomethylophilaceae archaeon]|nr:bi-functional transferase/deacetylase [Candidatus Methanomethylophilaceae archaeon]
DILRMHLEKAGYETVYAPEATILNHGPDTARDYIKQRTRVNIGENYLKTKFDYELPTHNYKLLVRAYINSIREMGFHPLRSILAVWLEIYPRLKARAYVRQDKGDMCVWDQVTTTKKL